MDMARAKQSEKSHVNVSSKEPINASTGVPVLDMEIGEPGERVGCGKRRDL